MDGFLVVITPVSKLLSVCCRNVCCNIRSCSLYIALVILLFPISEVQSDGNVVWNLPRPLFGYRSYLDVSPVKFVVPHDVKYMNFSFTTMKSRECPQKLIRFAIQRGGLPLIMQNNLSFPDNFVVTPSYLSYSTYPGFFVSFPVFSPKPGSWYVIGYHEDVNTDIRQKGLNDNDNCIYSFVSRLHVGPSFSHQELELTNNQTHVMSSTEHIFRFRLPPLTFSYQVELTYVSANCSLSLRNLFTPLHQSWDHVVSCNSSDPCTLTVASPDLQRDFHFMEVTSNIPGVEITYELKNVSRCDSVSQRCLSMPKLDRVQMMEQFTTVYGDISMMVISLMVDPSAASYIVTPFDVLEPNDIGSTLKFRMHLINSTNTKWTVCGALVYDHLPDMSGDLDVCEDVKWGQRVNQSDPSLNDVVQYVPYPQAGPWHIVLQAVCSGESSECPPGVLVEMSLEVQQCVEKGCNDKGQCEMVIKGSEVIVYSACICNAGYKGYACTDSTDAMSEDLQQVAAYLLTLSNLFFIPAIVIAARRGFVVEAFVYFYTMFFSTFYHACDGERLMKYRMCIMEYDVLQLADFFGSASALWFTVLAMACIPYRHVTPLLQVAGPFGLFIGVVFDRHSLAVIAIPMFSGLALILFSWGRKMYKRKKLYPSLKRYLLYLVPGIILAASGASVFSFVETQSNYKFVHSFWHACLALCICFLLPPKRFEGNSKNKNDNMTTLLLSPLPSHHSNGQMETTSTCTNEHSTNGAAHP